MKSRSERQILKEKHERIGKKSKSMSKGVVCEPGRHPITFATPKFLHNIADNTNSNA